jgi:RNA polymerase sigma factor (sigma-70 family)
MTRAATGLLIRHIRRLVHGDRPDPTCDAELLRRWAAQRDEEAFALLVRRHGPMVWNVCRRALAHQDAEDVFQAAFLVLARKAAAVRWRDSIAPWLYAVAQRLVCRAKAEATRRPRTGLAEPAVTDPIEAMTARELLAALDGEVAALPERYRGPVVLCGLESHTQEQAADKLGLSLSTLRRRLDRGQRLLHTRLARRGLAPAIALVALTASRTGAAPPRSWAASSQATALADGFMATASSKLKILVALLFLGVAVAGVGWSAFAPAPPETAQAKIAQSPVVQPEKRVDALGDPLPPGAILRLGSIRLRHGGTIFSAVFSPTADELVSAGWDKTIRFWDPATGKQTRHFAGPEKGLAGAAYSPDGKLLAGAGLDNVVYLWDAATGKQLHRLDGHKQDVRVLAFSRKGDLLATCDATTVRLWDVARAKPLWQAEAKDDYHHAVAFAPDGKTLAVGGNDKVVRLYDTATGKVRHELSGQEVEIAAVIYSPDGKRVLATSYRDTRQWDAATGKPLGKFGVPLARGNCVTVSPDDKLLAMGCGDGNVRLFDWTGKEVRIVDWRVDRARSLSFSRDGKLLSSIADGGTIHINDVATGQPRGVCVGHQERLNSTICTPDGKTIITGAWDGTVRVWDAKTGKELRCIDMPRKAQDKSSAPSPVTVSHVAVSTDSKQIAAVRSDETAVVWDAATGKQVFEFLANCVAFSPDGTLIAAGGRGTTAEDCNQGVIRLHDRKTGKVVRELRGHLTTVASVHFTPDGKTLVSSGHVLFGLRSGEPGENETKFVRIWDVASGKERKGIPGTARIYSANLTPDGRTVATTSMLGKSINLIEVVTGASRGELAGHTDMVFQVALSPDGRTLASAGMDGTVRLWDPFTGKELAKLEGHDTWVLTVAFGSDGKTLVSGSLDTTALVWDVSAITGRFAKPTALTAAQLNKCWEDLGGFGDTAFAAIGRLRATPQQAVALLGKQLKPAPASDAKQIDKLLADLGSEQFKTRDLATKELEKLGEVAAPALRKALTGEKLVLEVRQRIERLLERLEDAALPPETLRQVRAVEALEGIGDGAARQVLEALAKGAPEARQTREARGALERLAKR